MNPHLPKALLLDLDDTILDDSGGIERSWKGACAGSARELGTIDPESLYQAIERTRAWFWSDLERHRRGRLDLSAAAREVVALALGECGAADASLAAAIAEMGRFLEWFDSEATTEPVLKAALAHLWFVTIHPFDDGNGRIARAIADMALARSEGSSRRFYSMSGQIREERGEYYRILEHTQRGTMDVTAWMEWFLACLTRAIQGAQGALSDVIEKARYWEKLRDIPQNDRQRLMINKLLEGFEGKLTTSKWAALTKSSKDTALRDIQQLVDRGVLVRNPAGGRSSRYALGQMS